MNTKENFTKRELDVLTSLANGNSNKEIAENLYISIHTVKSHLETLYSKLGARNRVSAAVLAVKLGIIE